MPTPPLVICTRFGIGVTDEGWLRHRVPLVRGVTASSLLGQSDPDFRWAIFLDSGLPGWLMAELEEMIAPFEERAFFVFDQSYTGRNVHRMVQKLGFARGDMMLTGRLDDDDALHPLCVSNLRGAASGWRPTEPSTGAVFTFPSGLEWVMYDMLDVNKYLLGRRITRNAGVRPLRRSFMSMSIFALSSVADGVTMLHVRHPTGELFGTDARFDTIEIDDNQPMWLYCRHKQVDSGAQRSAEEPISISVDQLCDMFSLNAEIVSDYLSSAEEHGYITQKKTVGLRMKARHALLKAERAMSRSDPNDPDAAALRDEVDSCRARLEELSAGLVADLDAENENVKPRHQPSPPMRTK